MKEFFLILLFSKTILLTPDPINLHGRLELVPDKSIRAITSGASVQIDVSSLINKDENEGILAFRKRLLGMFPPKTISAKLLGEDAGVVLQYDGGYSFNKDGVWLGLYAENGIPTDIEFKRVVIESSIKLNGIKILWKNYRH